MSAQVDKMLGKHQKTQVLLKRLNELGVYTDPSFIMRYDPANFIKRDYVLDSTTRLQVSGEISSTTRLQVSTGERSLQLSNL